VAEKIIFYTSSFYVFIRGDFMADISSFTGKKKSSWIKWAIIVLIILVVLWYLNNQGYIGLF